MKKKTLANIDLIGQAIFLLIVTVLFIWGFTKDDEFFLGMLVGIFFLGIWQVIFSFIYTLSYKDKQRQNHLKIVVAYFVIIIPLSFFFYSEYVSVPGLIIAGLIAIWCFGTTIKIKSGKEPETLRPEIPEILDDINYQSK